VQRGDGDDRRQIEGVEDGVDPIEKHTYFAARRGTRLTPREHAVIERPQIRAGTEAPRNAARQEHRASASRAVDEIGGDALQLDEGLLTDLVTRRVRDRAV
jgi:hypothetical protein